MRVGLLAPIAPEKIGGGYTFEQEIFERILELAPASKHELVIFEGFRGAKARTRSPGFKYVPLQRPRFDFLVPRKRRFPWEFKWIDNVLNREGIEFFLNTTFEAVAHLKRTDNLRLPVVFTGSDQGNERAVRELVEKMQMQDQVFFLGHVSRETLKVLYQNALALCYVSFFGPENMPPLEAFGLGCPVIAADVPGASEQLGDAAIRVNPSDKVAIAEALKLVFQDES